MQHALHTPTGRISAVTILILLAATTSASHGQDDPLATQPGTPATLPAAGFWPTPKMMRALIERGAVAIAERYRLDDDQLVDVAKHLLDEYPKLFDRHRAHLQPVINDILELRLAREEPTEEHITRMARNLQPFLQDARKSIRKTNQVVRPLLRPHQKRLWDADFVRMIAVLSVTDSQLAKWRRGEFSLDDWPLSAVYGMAEAGARESDLAADTAAGLLGGKGRATSDASRYGFDAGQPEVPLDRWQTYVKEFIRRHELGEAQTHQAKAVLKDVQRRARAHEKQNEIEYRRIKRELREAKGNRRAELVSILLDLRKPLRDLFDELRGRLESLLRSDQR